MYQLDPGCYVKKGQVETCFYPLMSEHCSGVQCAPLPWFACMLEAVPGHSVYGWMLLCLQGGSVSSDLQPAVFLIVF